MTKHDAELELFKKFNHELQTAHDDQDDGWRDSPFGWIKKQPSRRVGMLGEQFVSMWLSYHGLNVEKSPNSDADRIVCRQRVEIKFSTRWASGVYKFQQIRDQEYDFMVLFGLSPDSAGCWAIPKQDILRLWKKEHVIESQHGGNGGNDTAWLSFKADQPPDWIGVYGGTLAEGLQRIRSLTSR